MKILDNDGLTSVVNIIKTYYALLNSPALTGTPTAPTAAAGTNTTQVATTAFVQSAVSGLVDSAPQTLDTLNELAAALGDDPNFATTIATQIGGKADATHSHDVATTSTAGFMSAADKAKLDGISSDNITAFTTQELYEMFGVPMPFNLESYAENKITDYESITTLPQENIEELTDITLMANAGGAFYGCQALTSLSSVETTWDTSNVTDMSYMFDSCYALTSLGVSNWNTSKVTDMGSMFGGCSALTSLDVSNWDTSSVTNMYLVFGNCSALTSLDVSNWDTSKVTDIKFMFSYCQALTSLDVSNWDTSNVTNMNDVFQECTSLTSLDVSNWNTSNVTVMIATFWGCIALTSLDVSNWDTSNVTSMSSIFSSCSALTSLDVSDWDTSNVTDMKNMFSNCNNLQYLIIGSDTFKFQLLSDTGLNSTCKILVPQALISTYQAATNWSDHASQFEPIENYTITRSNGQVTVTPNA